MLIFENDKEFLSLAKKMVDITSRDKTVIIRNATKDFLKGAYKATPISDRYKSVYPIYHKNKILKWAKSDKKILIRGRGFAAACWITAMRALGMTNKFDKNLKGKSDAKNFGSYSSSNSYDNEYIEVINACPYIDKMNARGDIMTKGINNAKKMLSQGLEKLSKKLKSEFDK